MSPRCRSIAGLLLALTLTALAAPFGFAQDKSCAVRPTPALSDKLPADVCIPDGFTGIALDY